MGDEIPREIDDHYRLYGEEPWVSYGEKRPLCGAR